MFYEIMVPQSTKTLRNLKAILMKGAAYAETKKFEPEVLLNSRLAPDQFNLLKQIQIATDTAKLGAQRLTDKEAPKHDDQEKTFAEIYTRIDQVIGYLGTLTAKDFSNSADKHVTTPRWEGKWLTGQEFMIQHVLPNLNFHVTTAYAILRHNGVDIGKKDFLGELPYKK